MCNYGKAQRVLGLCAATQRHKWKDVFLACASSFCPKKVKLFFPTLSRLLIIWENQPEGAGWRIIFQRSCWGSIKVGYLGVTELWHPWCWLVPNMELLVLPGLLPGEAEFSACKMLQTFFIPEECLNMFGFFFPLIVHPGFLAASGSNVGGKTDSWVDQVHLLCQEVK